MTETVFELFEAAALRVPEGGCLCAPPMTGRPYHPEGVEIGYREARERVAALSALYRAAGYGRGHRVALLLENRPDFHLHWWALNALGCGIVPINPAYRRDEMVYLLDHSEAALAVSTSRFRPSAGIQITKSTSMSATARTIPSVGESFFPTKR